MWASRALRTGVVGLILTLAAGGLALSGDRNAGALVAGVALPLALVILALGLRELGSDTVDGARRRGAAVGLALATIALLAGFAFLHSLGVELPWRLWRLADPRRG